MAKNTQSTAQQTQSRKDEHVDLALKSRNEEIDSRFYYEPMLSAHPNLEKHWPTVIGTKTLKYPIWVSSMTGGTDKTNAINQRLAKAVGKYGLGMGVGSARIALEDSRQRENFKLRSLIGAEGAFYLNFGIAQIEQLIAKDGLRAIEELCTYLEADGVIIHVNPLQEWLQPEGDRIKVAPIKTIKQFIDQVACPVIVKEVGQGFGYQSLKALMELPITAIEFAANGGTNFSKLELMRQQVVKPYLLPFVWVGQSAEEMVQLSNQLLEQEPKTQVQCRTFIISGGIQNFLDGFYLIKRSKGTALYGQASAFLRPAMESQEALNEFIEYQIQGLLLARAFLSLKENRHE